jgi:YidC/Oxa1 family membrane protein insertase
MEVMRQNIPNVVVFIALAVGLTGLAWYVDKTYFPKPVPKPTPPQRESLLALAGGAVASTSPALEWPMRVYIDPTAPKPEAPKPVVPEVVAPPKPSQPAEFVALGDDGCYNQVLLTSRGAGIIQLRLPRFDEANRLGQEVRDADKQSQKLMLIPGVLRPRDKTTLTEPDGGLIPRLVAGPEPKDLPLHETSYALLHYPAEDDPIRQPADADRLNDKYPSAELGERIWNVVEKTKTAEGNYRVVFETTLNAPYFLKLKKNFTLSPKDYHVGMSVDIEPLPGRVKDKGRFRYQIVGPHGVPVEGEWYSTTYRNVMTGYLTSKGGARRAIDDAATIHTGHGGTQVPKGDNTFTYVAVGTQYFASSLAIDDTQSAATKAAIWEYVRPTREVHPWDTSTQLFFADVTFRAVSYALNPTPTETISHKYLIYNGPIKVRLLKQLTDKQTGEAEVSEELVDRYLDKLTLNTMTDYHSPNALARFANSLYFTDVVIFFTNLMHSLLGFFHQYVPIWGLNILMLTVFVKMLLFLPSRRQQATMAKMAAVNAALKPEFDRLAEKHKDDPQTLQREKTALLLKNGVNPVATMGGCFLIFAQMPIFMGLYFCLQESVFFRLEPFLWFNSLASPDMTVWWTEAIPYVSRAESMGGSFSIYLGPFFNILPLFAVGFIFLQQWMSMPVAVDEQQQMQQKMMKFMVIMMAIFFYKSPAGLCLYFICSSLWGLMERKLIKKPVINATNIKTSSAPQPLASRFQPPEPEAPKGFMGRLFARVEEMQKQADAQNARQIRNEPQDGGKKKKKRK